MNSEVGTGIVSIPIAIMCAGGVIKYDEARELNRLISEQDYPSSFAELVLMAKTAKDIASETVLKPSGGS